MWKMKQIREYPQCYIHYRSFLLRYVASTLSVIRLLTFVKDFAILPESSTPPEYMWQPATTDEEMEFWPRIENRAGDNVAMIFSGVNFDLVVNGSLNDLPIPSSSPAATFRKKVRKLSDHIGKPICVLRSVLHRSSPRKANSYSAFGTTTCILEDVQPLYFEWSIRLRFETKWVTEICLLTERDNEGFAYDFIIQTEMESGQ